jgi:uncharacterized protein (DUF58 family)
MVAFEFNYSEELQKEYVRYIRAKQKYARWMLLLKMILGVALVAVIITLVLMRGFAAAMIVSLFLVALIFARRVGEWFSCRAVRCSPEYNQHFKVQLSADGYAVIGNEVSTQIKWTKFTEAVRSADCFSLYMGPLNSQWLPFRALTEGSIEEAAELIRANVPKYSEV